MITIFDNWDTEKAEEVAKEFLEELAGDEERDLEEEPITEQEVWNQVAFEQEDNWDITIKGGLFPFMEAHKCIFFGTVGRWNGTFTGGKVGDFEELFNDLIQSCDYVQIYETRGHLFIRGIHHDGSNEMEVKFLTDKGYELYDNWEYDYKTKWSNLSEQEVHEKLVKNYSRLPHFCKKSWGAKEVA